MAVLRLSHCLAFHPRRWQFAEIDVLKVVALLHSLGQCGCETQPQDTCYSTTLLCSAWELPALLDSAVWIASSLLGSVPSASLMPSLCLSSQPGMAPAGRHMRYTHIYRLCFWPLLPTLEGKEGEGDKVRRKRERLLPLAPFAQPVPAFLPPAPPHGAPVPSDTHGMQAMWNRLCHVACHELLLGQPAATSAT